MKHHLTTMGMNRPLAKLVIALLGLVLAASCSADGPEASVASTPTTSANASDVELTDEIDNDADAEVGETTDLTEADNEAPAVVVPETPVDRIGEAAEVLAAGVVLEAHDMRVEDSGVQLRVERIVQRADATFVRLAIVNGADEDRQVPHHEVATLTTSTGSTLQAVDAFPTRGVTLEPGESSIVVLVFPPTDGSFDLEVGVDGLLDSPFSPLVRFGFDDLDPASVVSGLQPDAPLAALGTHANGSQIELDGIRFTSDRIGVQIDYRNGADRERWLFGADPTFLEDNLGNRYRALVKPNGRSFFEVEPESSLSGVLTFAGRMDPRATSFSIFLNDGGLLTNPLAKSPAIVLGPFDVGAEQSIELPVDVEVDLTIDRTNGSTGTLSAVRFDETTIRTELTIINESDEIVDFNDGLIQLVDSEGITYQPQIAELPELVMSPGEGFEGEIVFSGRLQPTATTVQLRINQGVIKHSFFFDPIEIEQSSTTLVGSLSSFEVGDWSTFVTGSLETSSVAAIAVAIAEFDGVEVEGGVLLTLPESILFDFGESTLRPDAAASISLVADILEFYEGDEVLVVGHTDSIGDDASNLTLSIARANAVLEGLVAQGVDPDLLLIEGRGESEPVAANEQADGSDNPAGRQLNRRVEIFIETTKGIPEG